MQRAVKVGGPCAGPGCGRTEIPATCDWRYGTEEHAGKLCCTKRKCRENLKVLPSARSIPLFAASAAGTSSLPVAAHPSAPMFGVPVVPAMLLPLPPQPLPPQPVTPPLQPLQPMLGAKLRAVMFNLGLPTDGSLPAQLQQANEFAGLESSGSWLAQVDRLVEMTGTVIAPQQPPPPAKTKSSIIVDIVAECIYRVYSEHWII